MELHTNGALILVRLGKMSLRHTETMIPRGRVDEITKDATDSKRFTADPVSALVLGRESQAIRTVAHMARALFSGNRCPSVWP